MRSRSITCATALEQWSFVIKSSEGGTGAIPAPGFSHLPLIIHLPATRTSNYAAATFVAPPKRSVGSGTPGCLRAFFDDSAFPFVALVLNSCLWYIPVAIGTFEGGPMINGKRDASRGHSTTVIQARSVPR